MDSSHSDASSELIFCGQVVQVEDGMGTWIVEDMRVMGFTSYCRKSPTLRLLSTSKSYGSAVVRRLRVRPYQSLQGKNDNR